VRQHVLEQLTADQELKLEAIVIQSPGWATMIGKLNPFTIIERYLKLFRDWKGKKRQLELQNEKLAQENEKKRIENERV